MTQNIFETCQEMNPSQAWGLLALIALAQRESTTIEYQLDEWRFDDVPCELVNQIDELEDNQQIELMQGILAGGISPVEQDFA